MTRMGLFGLLVVAGALTGCEAVIVNGEAGEGGAATGGAGGGNTTTTGPGPDPAPANGYADADGFGYDVRLGNFGMSCGDTSLPACSSTAHYALAFRLDGADVFVGNAIPLRWETNAMDIVSADEGQGCGIGHANFNGLVEITGVDADSIQMLVSYGQGQGISRLDRVPFDVPICGDPTPAPLAIAMTQDEYLNGGPIDEPINGTVVGTTAGAFNTVAVSVSTGGPAIDPDALRLFLGSRPPACEYPTSVDCSEPYWNVDLVLPPALQHVGTYSLYELGTFSEGDVCYNGGGGGSFWDGTIQVVAIDDYEITFTLAGTNSFFFTGASADGTYTAPRCW